MLRKERDKGKCQLIYCFITSFIEIIKLQGIFVISNLNVLSIFYIVLLKFIETVLHCDDLYLNSQVSQKYLFKCLEKTISYTKQFEIVLG